MDQPLAIDERVSEICNAQSMGAAIENMTLAATELGLGSLWICNTFFAQEELNHWLNADGQLYAALAVGYADEAPAPRPRRKAELTVEWRSNTTCIIPMPHQGPSSMQTQWQIRWYQYWNVPLLMLPAPVLPLLRKAWHLLQRKGNMA